MVRKLDEKYDYKHLLDGKNITLHTKQLDASLSAQANNKLFISSESIVLNNSGLSANNELNLIAKNDIGLTDTSLSGHGYCLIKM
ncbi:MAG: hypothetical protein ACL7BU_15640 [Candidatus Phlomobacter fragariae]